MGRPAPGWAQRQAPVSALASIGMPAPLGFTELMARSLDTMQAQIARVQMALDINKDTPNTTKSARMFNEIGSNGVFTTPRLLSKAMAGIAV